MYNSEQNKILRFSKFKFGHSDLIVWKILKEKGRGLKWKESNLNLKN